MPLVIPVPVSFRNRPVHKRLWQQAIQSRMFCDQNAFAIPAEIIERIRHFTVRDLTPDDRITWFTESLKHARTECHRLGIFESMLPPDPLEFLISWVYCDVQAGRTELDPGVIIPLAEKSVADVVMGPTVAKLIAEQLEKAVEQQGLDPSPLKRWRESPTLEDIEPALVLVDCLSRVSKSSKASSDALLAELRKLASELHAHRTDDLAQVLAAVRTEMPGRPAPASNYVFRRNGNVWEVCYEVERGHFSDKKGFGIISQLLRFPHPTRPLNAVDLLGADPCLMQVDSSPQAASDKEALREYRQQLSEYDAEIEEARTARDTPRAERLAREKQEVVDKLKADTAAFSRFRSLKSAAGAQSARVSVKANVTRAIKDLRDADPPLTKLAEHLDLSIITEGDTYAYRPSAAPAWQLD